MTPKYSLRQKFEDTIAGLFNIPKAYKDKYESLLVARNFVVENNAAANKVEFVSLETELGRLLDELLANQQDGCSGIDTAANKTAKAGGPDSGGVAINIGGYQEFSVINVRSLLQERATNGAQNMKNGFTALARAKSKKPLAGAGGLALNIARHGADRLELAYQAQAAEQAHAALKGRLDDGKAFSEVWMRMYVKRGA